MNNALKIKTWMIIVLLSAGFATTAFPIAAASTHTDVSVATAWSLFSGSLHPNLVILDVRNQSEFDAGCISRAILIPVGQLQQRIEELSAYKNTELLVYCSTGERSHNASLVLDANNFTKVYDMTGGLTAWNSSGYPIVTPIQYTPSNWTLITTRGLKAYPELTEYVWQKNASLAPNGPYDRIGLHRVVKVGANPKGTVFVLPGIFGSGERLVSNPPSSNFTVTENMSQCLYWANRGFDVYTIDYRMHFVPANLNASQLSFMADWGIEQMIGDIKEAVDKAKDVSGVSKVFIVGMSMGGGWAQYYAAKYWQQDLRGIILLDPSSKAIMAKPPNLTNSFNLTSAVDTMKAFGNWSWETPQQSYTASSLNPGYLFLAQYAAQNPTATAQWPNGTLLKPTINPRTNTTWANIAEYFEYQLNSGKSSNSYAGYGDNIVNMYLISQQDRYMSVRPFLDSSAMVDWAVSPFISFDFLANVKKVNVPVLGFRSGLLGIPSYGNLTNGMATSDFTSIILQNYGHTDVFQGTYSAIDVSEPAYRWMLDRLSTPPTIDQNTFMTSAKTVNSGSGAVQSVFAQGATVKFAFNLQSLGSEGRVVYRVTIQQPDLVAYVVSSSAIVSASQGLQWTTFMLPSGTPKGTWSGQIQVYAADGITALAVKTLYFAVT